MDGTDGYQACLRGALSDHYTIERAIGQGGMARVFLAEDQYARDL